MNARVVVAVMACVFSASALAKDEPRSAKDIIANVMPRCPQVMSDNMSAKLASIGMTLTKEQVKRTCDCIGAELGRTVEPERQYTPTQFEPFFTTALKGCVAPEAKKAFIPYCMAEQRKSVEQNKEAAKKRGLTDKTFEVYCECASNIPIMGMDLDLSTEDKRAEGAAKAASMRDACIQKAFAKSAP